DGIRDFHVTGVQTCALPISLLWAGLLVNAFPVNGSPVFTDLFSSVTGAAAGYLSLWLVYWLFKLATGKEGMGYGDFKLLGAIGRSEERRVGKEGRTRSWRQQ